MKDYKITMAIDSSFPNSNVGIIYNNEHTTTWHGYDAQQAIAQAMLSYAYNGARELKVLEIIEK